MTFVGSPFSSRVRSCVRVYTGEGVVPDLSFGSVLVHYLTCGPWSIQLFFDQLFSDVRELTTVVGEFVKGGTSYLSNSLNVLCKKR